MTDRRKYQNPSPPPGYVSPDAEIVYKKPFQMIDGVCCQFLGLIIESGALEPNALTEFIIQTSDEEDSSELPSSSAKKELPTMVDVEDPSVIKTDSSELPSSSAKKELPTMVDVEEDPSVIKTETNVGEEEFPNVIGLEEEPPLIKNENIDLVTVKKELPILIDLEEDSPFMKTENISLDAVKKELPILIDLEEDSPFMKTGTSSAKSSILKDRRERSESRDSTSSRRKKRKVLKHQDSISSDSSENSDYEIQYIKSKLPAKKYAGNIHEPYFCEICKISLNSQGALQNHLIGKRHHKALNAKKSAKIVFKSITPPEVISRYPQPSYGVHRVKIEAISVIQKVVEKSASPCPGLENVVEIQGIKDICYYCKMCDSPCTPHTVLPHLQGLKHKMSCLKFFKPEIHAKYHYRKGIEKQVIEQYLSEIEKEVGCGRLAVEKDFYDLSETICKERNKEMSTFTN